MMFDQYATPDGRLVNLRELLDETREEGRRAGLREAAGFCRGGESALREEGEKEQEETGRYYYLGAATSLSSAAAGLEREARATGEPVSGE